MLSSSKQPATIVSKLIQELESFWASSPSLKEQQILSDGNRLLGKFLEMSVSHRVKKPDWRNVYSRHISAISSHKNKALALYHFKIASQLSREISIANLSHLLKKQPIIRGINHSDLKINYFKYLNDPKNFSFVEKVAMKLCKYITTLQFKNDEVEDILKHYLLSLVSNVDPNLRDKMGSIVIAALDSYCVYHVKQQAAVLEIKLNVFNLMNNLIQHYNRRSDDDSFLVACLNNFFILIRTDAMKRFVSQSWQFCRLKEITQNIVNFLMSLQSTQFFRSKNLLEKFHLSILYAKQSKYYFEHSQNRQQQRQPNNRISCILSLLAFQSEISQLRGSGQLVQLNQQLPGRMAYLLQVRTYFNRQDALKILNVFLTDFNNLVVQNLSTLIRALNVHHILKMKCSDMREMVMWRPICQATLKVLEMIDEPRYESVIPHYHEYLTYIFVSAYLLNPSEHQILKQWTQMLSKPHASILSRSSSTSVLIKVLLVINKFCLSQYCSPQFQSFISVVCTFNLHYVIQDSKCHIIFSPFLQNNSSEQPKRYQIIFRSRLLEIYIKTILKAYLSLSSEQLRQNQANWNLLLSTLIRLVGKYEQDLSDEALEGIVDSLVGLKGSQGVRANFKFLKDIVWRQAFNLLQREDFINIPKNMRTLRSLLQFFKRIVAKKDQLFLDEKIEFIDFCFNLKSSLSSVSLKARNTQDLKQLHPQLQYIIDQIELLEILFLKSTPADFIKGICQILSQETDPDLCLLASVAVKQIYCLIYPQCFVFSEDFPRVNLQTSPSPEELGPCPKDQFFFIQEELQGSSEMLKMIKNSCRVFEDIFRRVRVIKSLKLIGRQIGLVQGIEVEIGQIQSLRLHLIDLVYMTFLCELHSFQNILISLYISLIEPYGIQIYLFQIARFIALQMIEPQEAILLQEYMHSELKKHDAKISEPFRNGINLLTKGQASKRLFQSKRIFRILYFLKADALAIANDYKTFIWFLCLNVFSFFRQPFDIYCQTTILKASRPVRVYNQNKKDEWISGVWEQDWSYLRLLILFSKKILRKLLQLNELSKIRSFLPFSVAILIKSGSLDELTLPLRIMFLKKKHVNYLYIADCLKRIVLHSINTEQYKKIDRILCNKRRSLSMGLNLEGFARITDRAFEKSGKIGMVLAEIFMTTIFEMLSANRWQRFRCQRSMSIYCSSLGYTALPVIDHLNSARELSLVEEIEQIKEICATIPSILFEDYQKALIIKDFISQFIDEAIQQSDTLSAYQNIELDKIILDIAVTFEEFNFTIKEFWSQHCLRLSLSDSSSTTIQSTQSLFLNYKRMASSYRGHIEYKLTRIHSIRYPLNILFPLGRFVYNIACKNSLLITFVRRVNFQDNIEVCQNIIRVNHEILKLNDLNSSINHKKRKGLDNELGKVILSSDCGVVDFDLKSISPSSILNEVLEIHPSLVKFLELNSPSTLHHLEHFVRRFKLGDLQHIKNKLQKVALKIEQNLKLKQGRDNILLYAHYQYLCFPIQGIQSVATYKNIYRIPSLTYLLLHQDKQRIYDTQLCKYLINTRNDLPETEKKFENIKKKFTNWVGIVGRLPPAEEIATLLNRNLFLYMGHGTGFEHIPPSEYINFQPQCVMLVYGCSSSLMTHHKSEPSGCSFDFLMRGCPAYLGCLWNVTDVDMDRITAEMLLQVGDDGLSSILTKSKLNCYYPNLNGASVVVYGLPSTLIRR